MHNNTQKNGISSDVEKTPVSMTICIELHFSQSKDWEKSLDLWAARLMEGAPESLQALAIHPLVESN